MVGKLDGKKKKSSRGIKGKVSKEVASVPDSFLAKFSSPGSDLPQLKDPMTGLTIRIFEKDSELKEAFKKEFAIQLDELHACSKPDCNFRYVAEEGDADPTVRMLVHHYLHLARESEDKIKILALNRMVEILNPPRDRMTEGALSGGVLTAEEKKFLRLSKEESEDL